MKHKYLITFFIISLIVNGALIILCYNYYVQNKNLTAYANLKLQSYFIDIGKNIKMLDLLFDEVNVESSNSLSETEFEKLKGSYTDFYYTYIEILKLGETIKRLEDPDTNLEQMFYYKKQLDHMNIKFDKPLKKDQREIILNLKEYINNLHKELNHHFQRFAIQTYESYESSFTIHFRDNLKPSDFNYELETFNDAWVHFVQSVSKLNKGD